MTKFLVGLGYENFSEGKFQLVEAENSDEAKIKFIKNQNMIDDEFFTEYLSSKSEFDSFAGKFWQEPLHNQQIFLGVGQTISQEKFEEKIKNFFENNSDYADIYLKEYFSDAEEIDLDTFPEEMQILIYMKTNKGDLATFELDKLHLKQNKRWR
ncbi:MAG: hypothetical protein LUM44_09965 [Pyrinomonadaceae bacterium]|nr:hypothetical protein [Pyrinomonadaceae bacterium]